MYSRVGFSSRARVRNVVRDETSWVLPAPRGTPNWRRVSYFTYGFTPRTLQLHYRTVIEYAVPAGRSTQLNKLNTVQRSCLSSTVLLYSSLFPRGCGNSHSPIWSRSRRHLRLSARKYCTVLYSLACRERTELCAEESMLRSQMRIGLNLVELVPH